MRGLAFVLLVGCSGGVGDAAFPIEPGPAARLVECRPAKPVPTLLSEVASARLSTRAMEIPRMTLGKISGDGHDLVDFKRLVTAQVGAMARCYANTAAPKASEVHLEVVIGDTGKVTAVHDTIDKVRTSRPCVRNALNVVTFKPAATGAALDIELVFATKPPTPEQLAAVVEESEPWTPFAIDPEVPGEHVLPIARATEGALRGKLAAIGACFKPGAPNGSLRIMLELSRSGSLVGARAGGLGDKAIEDCARKALAGLQVAAPITSPAEVACDVAHGDAAAWKLSLDAGYAVIDVANKQLTFGKETLAPSALDPKPLEGVDKTFAIVAEPDAKGAMLTLALAWAHQGATAIVGVRDGKAARFVGMGVVSSSRPEDPEDIIDDVHPALRLSGAQVVACIQRTRQPAKLGEPTLVTQLLQNLASKCRSVGCVGTLAIGIDPDAQMKDLVEVTSAARRAGFDRILLGGEECSEYRDKPVRPPPPDDEDDDDDDF